MRHLRNLADDYEPDVLFSLALSVYLVLWPQYASIASSFVLEQTKYVSFIVCFIVFHCASVMQVLAKFANNDIQ